LHDPVPALSRRGPAGAGGPPMPVPDVPVPFRPLSRPASPEDEPPAGARGGAAPGRHGADRLRGLRVLIVEDEFFVAVEIEEILASFGCAVVGIAPDFGGALQAVGNDGFDVAVLDINLNGQDAYPVVDMLVERRKPFLFATGYTANSLPEAYRRFLRVQKPVEPEPLRECLVRLLADLAD
jgi:CheY-like chemotaxis protein